MQPCRITASTGALPINCGDANNTGNVLDISYDFHLGSGNNGNVWAITNNKDANRNQAFGYDQLNRLISAQNAGTDCTKSTVNGKTEYWGNNYGYDAWGNLLSKIITKCGGENLSLTAASNNQLQGGYAYDAAGNMTHDATANLNYTFDQENRITGAGGYAYTYDADGNRVEKSNGSAGTLYWYMSPGIVAESDLTGNLQSEYVFFNGERVARRVMPSNQTQADALPVGVAIANTLATAGLTAGIGTLEGAGAAAVTSDVTFTHFTNAAGLEGITGLDSTALSSGQTATVN